MQKRIYIAGPMSGLPDLNYPAFNAKAAELRAQGHHVENPAENPAPACGSWQGYMRMAIKQLATCDTVQLLTGWGKSKGACIERNLAKALGLELWGDEGALPLSELVQSVGDQNIAVQPIDGCCVQMRYTRTGTKLTIETGEGFSARGLNRFGLVLWMDRDKAVAALKGA